MARRRGGKRPGGRGRLRIIGGQWRGRLLPVPEVPGLRPSPDRVRETLFNWLAPVLSGARCLDLFCGSGALGFEALSRGAEMALLVDSDRRVAEQLRQNAALLGSGAAEVRQGDVLRYLEAGAAVPFDIVFLDPPFRKGLAARCLDGLAAGGWLRSGSYVYIEVEAELQPLPLPPGWELYRSRVSGQVGYHLALVP